MLADGAGIRKMKIYAVNSLFASVNFLSQSRAFPWPSLHHLYIHKIHYGRTDGATECTCGWSHSSGRGCRREYHALAGVWGWVCGVPPLALLQPCMQPGPSISFLPGVAHREEA